MTLFDVCPVYHNCRQREGAEKLGFVWLPRKAVVAQREHLLCSNSSLCKQASMTSRNLPPPPLFFHSAALCQHPHRDSPRQPFLLYTYRKVRNIRLFLSCSLSPYPPPKNHFKPLAKTDPFESFAL